MNILTSLFSGLVGALIVAIIQGYYVRKQIASAQETQKDLITRIAEERNMLNTRLAEIGSALRNLKS